MEINDLRLVLEEVQAQRLNVDTALERLADAHIANLGYAHVDLERQQRCGFPEVIYCEGKTCDWVEGVVRKLAEAGQDCLATRVSAEQAEHLTRMFPQAQQDRVGRTFWLPAASPQQVRVPRGNVFVLTAGTADLPVAHEAVVTARAFGCEVQLIADVGVAGIHRVLHEPFPGVRGVTQPELADGIARELAFAEIFSCVFRLGRIEQALLKMLRSPPHYVKHTRPAWALRIFLDFF